MNRFKSPVSSARFKVQAKQFLRFAACWTLAAQLTTLPLASAANSASTPGASDKPASKIVNDPVMKVMQTELARATTDLGKKRIPRRIT